MKAFKITQQKKDNTFLAHLEAEILALIKIWNHNSYSFVYKNIL